MQGSNHFCFGNARNQGLLDRRSCCDPQRMAIETSFAEKVTRFQNSYDCFLAPLRNDGEFDLARLDVENRVRNVTLGKNNLILLIFLYCFPIAHFGEKFFWIKRCPQTLLHRLLSVQSAFNGMILALTGPPQSTQYLG